MKVKGLVAKKKEWNVIGLRQEESEHDQGLCRLLAGK